MHFILAAPAVILRHIQSIQTRQIRLLLLKGISVDLRGLPGHSGDDLILSLRINIVGNGALSLFPGFLRIYFGLRILLSVSMLIAKQLVS